MTPVDALTKRVHDIEQQILLMLDNQKEDGEAALVERLTKDAFVYAIRSLAKEIAAREGISEALFASRFEHLCRWHLDDLLRTASDIDPSLLARLDARHPDDIPTDATPPLVLSPPEAGSQ
jgi:hypothetical protein